MNIIVNKNKSKSIKRRLFNLFRIVMIVIYSSFLLMYIYQQFMVKQTEKNYPPLGSLVDIGDYKLHYYAIGERNDLPTIILESGSGTPSSYSDWRYIQPELAKYTRVISYDRAGYGWSDQAHTTRSMEQSVDDLHHMLIEAGETGPYILVGHSYGGLLSQLYAQRYPEEINGLVLIDSSIAELSPNVTDSQLKVTKLLRQLGVMRVMGNLGVLPVPEAVLTDKLSRELLYQRFYNDDQLSEIKQMMDVQLPSNSFGTIPVTIISAREEEKEHPDWQELQDLYLSLSDNSKRLIVEESGHYIHHDQPDIVIHEIETLLSIAEQQQQQQQQ